MYVNLVATHAAYNMLSMPLDNLKNVASFSIKSEKMTEKNPFIKLTK